MKSDGVTPTGLGLPLRPVVLALIRRPDLWTTALRSALSMAGRGWWRRSPFLPLPDPGWLRFRLATAYGGEGRVDADSPFEAADLITWLEWRKDWPSYARVGDDRAQTSGQTPGTGLPVARKP